MQVLLSSIGSRGDVQPLIALALELRALGCRARLCVAPNYQAWVESYGLEFYPVGPDLRKLPAASGAARPAPPTPEQLQQMAVLAVRGQFQEIAAAAQGCDLLLAAGALQFAARSLAEARRLPYVFAAYTPAVLPSPAYPPPKTGGSHPFTLPEAENLRLWEENAAEFNRRFGAALNEERAKLGLEPAAGVRDHIFTARPWLAADPVLAPAQPPAGMEVVQTGAWLLPDPAPLPPALEDFLAAGPPPLYLGLGSTQAPEAAGRVLVQAARALGCRALLSQGWANLTPGESGEDVFTTGDVDFEKLLPRVAAVVHHGGAGTTTAAARAGRPQVVLPHLYDQFYWAHRVGQLGLGAAAPGRDELSVERLVAALRQALQPPVKARARALAARMEPHGARRAAEMVVRYGVGAPR